jgi:hypothetical protein
VPGPNGRFRLIRRSSYRREVEMAEPEGGVRMDKWGVLG